MSLYPPQNSTRPRGFSPSAWRRYERLRAQLEAKDLRENGPWWERQYSPPPPPDLVAAREADRVERALAGGNIVAIETDGSGAGVAVIEGPDGELIRARVKMGLHGRAGEGP